MHHIDRLWYDGVLEVIRTGDVTTQGARQSSASSLSDKFLHGCKAWKLPSWRELPLGESPEERYEVVIKGATHVIVRNVEGFISKMPRSTKARREGNLTRGPDGNNESTVGTGYLPCRSLREPPDIASQRHRKGYVFAFIGDEQATPHFMRYSGLTGACINAMLFNNFIKQANRWYSVH